MDNWPRILIGVACLWAPRLAWADAVPAAPPVEPVKVTLSSPSDYEVFQRRTLEAGAVRVEGEWAVPRKTPPPDKLDGRLLAAGAQTGWSPLPFDPGARGFRADLPAAAGGWYRLEVRLWRGGQVVSTVTIPRVGVGEVFLIAGQSNSANYGEVRQKPETGLVVAFDGERWAPANDPQPGATGTKGSFIPSFGDALVRRYHVPVGVVCLGVGSTSVREWMPRDTPMTDPPTTGAHTLVLAGGKFVSSGELFGRLATALQRWPAGAFRAVLWHQGESDWNQPASHQISVEEYRSDLAGLIADSRVAAGWDVPWLVAQVSYHLPADTGSEAQRAAQRSVVDGRLTFAGPDTDEIVGAFREKNGQGVHMSAAGLKRHGEVWAEAVEQWLDAKGR